MWGRLPARIARQLWGRLPACLFDNDVVPRPSICAFHTSDDRLEGGSSGGKVAGGADSLLDGLELGRRDGADLRAEL